MIYWAVFLLSASSLAFEVLLARIFSISQWNHLSFMVISIALFGFGASGAFLSLLDVRPPQRENRWEKRFRTRSFLLKLVILYSISAAVPFSGLIGLPIDYFRLPLEPVQIFYLLAAYLLLSIPFFFTGTIMSIGFAALPEKTGLVYCAGMTGSAAGAVLPAVCLGVLGEGRMVILAALIPLLLPILGDLKRSEGRRTALWGVITLSTLIAFFSHSPFSKNSAWIRPSPYKALSQVLQFPRTSVEETHGGLRGRIDIVKSPYIRFAPGLSLRFTGSLPEQWAVYRDGDRPFVFYNQTPGTVFEFPLFSISFRRIFARSESRECIGDSGRRRGRDCLRSSGRSGPDDRCGTEPSNRGFGSASLPNSGHPFRRPRISRRDRSKIRPNPGGKLGRVPAGFLGIEPGALFYPRSL